jgi:hypothetical protein
MKLDTAVRRIKRKRPGIRRSRFLFSEDPLNKVNEMSNDIFVSASDMAEYMIQAVLKKRNDKQLESVRKDFGVYATHKEWDAYITHLSDYRCVQDSRTTGYFHDDENLSYLAYRIHNTHVSIELFGDDVFIDNLHKQFQKDFTFVTNQIEWIYSSDGSSMEVPLQPDRMPLNEMYPFLEGQNLGEYYDNFMKSNASILLLIGPPGTGKTTFIRGLLQHTNSSAIVTYDASILEKDYVFANFIEGDKSVMVMEDADMFLKSRQEGNTMMHKFLNVGDGLVTTRNKKMVFSTNLPSIKDIDSALVRPGRCYDILHFSELNQEQAEKLAVKAGVSIDGERTKWSIADVFFNQNTNVKPNKIKETKMGFV